MNLVEDYLANGDLSGAPVLLREFRPATSILVTPRYPDSRHVVVLLLDERGDPRIVGKVVRRPGDLSTLDAEAAVLRRLGSGPGEVAGTPRLLAFVEHREHWLLLETALNGRPLTHSQVRRHPARAWRLVDDWICTLPIVSSTAACEGWFDEQITNPLQVAAAAIPATKAEQRFFTKTKRLLSQLVDADVPVPVEHGDLSHPNLLITSGRQNHGARRREVAVIDWETGRVRGLVGADAAVFLAFVAFSIDGAHGIEPEAASYAKEFLRDDGAGRQRLAQHLMRRDVDPRWVDLVLLATWSRYALAAFPRLASPVGETVDRQRALFARDTFRSGRALRLWRLTMERLGR